jgi:hypothetical protein
MMKKFIAPVMVVIFGFCVVGEASFADPWRFRDQDRDQRELSTFEQVVTGVAVGAILLKVLTTPSQPQFVPAPSSTFVPNNMTFGYENGNTTSVPSQSISEFSTEFPRILRIFQDRGYSPISYSPSYMELVNRDNRSRVIVSTQRLSVSTYSLYSGEIVRWLNDAGYTLLYLRGAEIQFSGFFVYAN